MKFIWTKEKAFSEAQCQRIINLMDSSTLTPAPSKFANYSVMSVEAHLQEWTPILYAALEEYKQIHPFLQESCAWRLDSLCNYQKYSPNRYYGTEHCEHGPYKEDARRILAWTIYLNTIKKDGGTRFPQQNFTTPARVGDLLIWPASWTHSHHGINAPDETKYIITGWCCYLKAVR